MIDIYLRLQSRQGTLSKLHISSDAYGQVNVQSFQISEIPPSLFAHAYGLKKEHLFFDLHNPTDG